jgi:hypothetical protein
MDKWRGKILRAYLKAVCKQGFDKARIHKNLLPFRLCQGYGGTSWVAVLFGSRKNILFSAYRPGYASGQKFFLSS